MFAPSNNNNKKVIDNLKNADETHSDSKSQQTSSVTDKSYERYLLISFKQSVVWVTDVHL